MSCFHCTLPTYSLTIFSSTSFTPTHPHPPSAEILHLTILLPNPLRLPFCALACLPAYLLACLPACLPIYPYIIPILSNMLSLSIILLFQPKFNTFLYLSSFLSPLLISYTCTVTNFLTLNVPLPFPSAFAYLTPFSPFPTLPPHQTSILYYSPSPHLSNTCTKMLVNTNSPISVTPSILLHISFFDDQKVFQHFCPLHFLCCLPPFHGTISHLPPDKISITSLKFNIEKTIFRLILH